MEESERIDRLSVQGLVDRFKNKENPNEQTRELGRIMYEIYDRMHISDQRVLDASISMETTTAFAEGFLRKWSPVSDKELASRNPESPTGISEIAGEAVRDGILGDRNSDGAKIVEGLTQYLREATQSHDANISFAQGFFKPIIEARQLEFNLMNPPKSKS